MPEDTLVDDPTTEAARALIGAAFAVLQPLGPACSDEQFKALAQQVADSPDAPADVALAALSVIASNLGMYAAEEPGDA